MSRVACARCGSPDCLCGNHSFELGALFNAVGSFLHGESEREDLRKAYYAATRHVPGQWCNGEACGICVPVDGATSR